MQPYKQMVKRVALYVVVPMQETVGGISLARNKTRTFLKLSSAGVEVTLA